MNVDKLLVEAGAYFGGDGVNYDRFEPRKFAALVLATTPPQTEQEPWCMKMNGCKTKCEDCPDEPPQPEQEPHALQGLAAYLRCEAGGVFVGSPSHDALLQWAREVDAAKAQPALVQQEPVTIGEPVGWHSKQYGFVYMALQPHQFEVGSTLYLKDGTPAWRIESSCSKTALISMSSLPHGTVFYTSQPPHRTCEGCGKVAKP